MSNQTSTTDSRFKMPMAPPVYPSQSEALLFQDIIEEKTIALHSILNDFLKVHPYRKFDIEFNMFLKRVKQITTDELCAGANVSQITNSSHIAPLNTRPSTSFNYRPPSTMSMGSSSDHSSKLSNPFKPPDCFKTKVVLSCTEQSRCVSHKSPSTSSIVMKVSQNHNVTVEENNTHEIAQRSISLSTNQPTAHNKYSDVKFVVKKSVSESHKNENINDDNNSIESLLEDVGFKIIVGLPENKNETSKKSNASQHHKNQLNVLENVEQFLSMWSLNKKLIKPSEQSLSKYVLILTGNLLGEDKQTVVEKRHEAGILEARKEKSLVKTKNGLYRLVGNIISGSPNKLYEKCVSVNGIPRKWRHFEEQLTWIEYRTKHIFDFSITSPGSIAKSIKSAMNLDTSMTRKGTIYSKNIGANHKTNIKKKLFEYVTSTPEKPKKLPTIFESPSQILIKNINQNLSNNPNKQQKLDSVNDSYKYKQKKTISVERKEMNKMLKFGNDEGEED